MKLTLALAAVLGLALISVPATVNAQTPAPATTAPAKATADKKTKYTGTLLPVVSTALKVPVYLVFFG